MTRASSHLWAVTSYFNPAGSPRRYRNYCEFRARLRVPLVTVELGYGECELEDSDADLLIQIPGRDWIWQKERLLNLALDRLPSDCEAVAWLDCDVVFLEEEWPRLVSDALERSPLVQPFLSARQAAPTDGDPAPPPAVTRTAARSLASRMADGSVPLSIFSSVGSSQRFAYAPGYAWAARRELVEQTGLYDAFILGCGDKALAAAAYGRFDESARVYDLSEAHAGHYTSWARRFHRAVGGKVGFAQGTLLHLWHGDPVPRATRAPYEEFSRFEFDPSTDLAIDAGGSWRWATEKPSLHQYVAHSLWNRCPDSDDPIPAGLAGGNLRHASDAAAVRAEPPDGVR